MWRTAKSRFRKINLFFKEYPRVVVKDRKESTGRSESLTSLPAYITYDIAEYSFGSVAPKEHCFKPAYETNFKTVLDSMIKTYSR